MNPGEHAIMSQVEEYHWWYRSLRDVINACLHSPRFALPPAPRILDAGCGTGANLKALAALEPAYLGGFDPSQEGLEAARAKAPEAELCLSDICQPELHQGDLDLVVSTDVIYIPGAEAAFAGLQQIVNALRPGGLFLLNLPAYDWLFSEHDVAIHTRERYTARSVTALLDALGLQIELLSYRVCLLFPAVVATRLPSLFRARRQDLAAKSDLHGRPAGNELLYRIMAAETRLIARGVRLPFGSSVFAIARRR
jgi:SAM-dependent methyltransferase